VVRRTTVRRLLWEERPMVWWLVALVAWVVIAVGVGLLVGGATAVAERRERAQRVPMFVPEDWSLTPSR
jgi:hypothetical protein